LPLQLLLPLLLPLPMPLLLPLHLLLPSLQILPPLFPPPLPLPPLPLQLRLLLPFWLLLLPLLLLPPLLLEFHPLCSSPVLDSPSTVALGNVFSIRRFRFRPAPSSRLRSRNGWCSWKLLPQLRPAPAVGSLRRSCGGSRRAPRRGPLYEQLLQGV
jgi:hypothetical protein